MATWKKVIVSGSNAELNQITASGGINATLPSAGQSNFVAYNSSTGQFSYAGTGSFTAATASYITASNVYGPFGSNSILSASNAATASSTVGTLSAIGTGGISLSTAFNGSTGSTIALNGYAGFTSNGILKWNGSSLANSSLTDDGTTISTAASIQAGGTSSSLTGSFSGSFFGNGAGLTGVTATAIFPTTQRTNVTSPDKFFISQSTGQEYITYGDLLTDLAGTNLAVESSDSLTLATTITGITSITSTNFTGSLLGTASYASNSDLLDGLNSTAFVLNSQTSSMLAPYVLASQTSSMSVLSASYALSSSFSAFASTATSASNASTVTSIAGNVTNNTDNYILTATGGGSVNGESNLTFNGSLLTVSGNATITGDLTVAGTASFTNTDNLNIRDKFILINSGSNALADSGWITQYNTAGSGSAFYLDATSAGTYGRFAVAYDVVGTSTSLTVDEFVVTAKVNQSAPGASTPTWGGSGTNGQGNMWLTSTGDIYIWA